MHYHYIDHKVNHRRSFVSCFWFLILLSNAINENLIFLLVTGDFNARKVLRLNLSHVLTGSSKLFLILPIFSKTLLHIFYLLFTNQPNFVTDSDVHPSLHSNCHQQIVFSKLKLKIENQRLYERLLRNYKNADSQSINKAIEMFN